MGALLAILALLAPAHQQPRKGGDFLAFTQTPRRPGNVLLRAGVAGRSRKGRPIRLTQLGDPALSGRLLVFGCIHGDECTARGLQPVWNGCPDPRSSIFVVPNLNPDGFAAGTRLNARGVDLNRNFGSQWRPIGRPGDPQYSGPRPFSESETRLAAQIIERVQPEATVWFHQYRGARAFVRAWGQSAPLGRFFATRAGIPLHLLRWPAGTAPNWQNHRFPGTASFVVELPAGKLAPRLRGQLAEALVRLGRKVGQD